MLEARETEDRRAQAPRIIGTMKLFQSDVWIKIKYISSVDCAYKGNRANVSYLVLYWILNFQEL